LRALQAAAVYLACLPAGTLLAGLVPWWRTSGPAAALAATSAAAAALMAAISLAGPWRRRALGPAGVASGLTVAVIAADLAGGSTLSLVTVLGGQILVAGRFYGLGNPLFAVFATAAIYLALALAEPWWRSGRRTAAATVVAAIGLIATVVDLLPGLGADVGGPPALLPAFTLLALRVAGVRLTWRTVLLVTAGTAAAVAAVALLDWLRPPAERSHLGRFVQTTVQGDAWNVVARKVFQNVDMLTSSPLTLAMPAAAALIVWAVARPGRWRLAALDQAYRRLPLLPPALAAIGVLLAIGFAANDSGTSIPPAGALVALAIAMSIASGARYRRTPRVNASTAGLIPTTRPGRYASDSTVSRASRIVSRPAAPAGPAATSANGAHSMASYQGRAYGADRIQAQVSSTAARAASGSTPSPV
jgi:hypothetical protein